MVGDGDVGDGTHALLWSGPSGLPIDLHPTSLSGFVTSYAFATDGVRQVGDGFNGATTHALLWSGTASSAVDLQPTNLDGFSFSGADAIHGTQQVGSAGILSNAIYHAMLWNGTADSAVDLHPTNLDGFESSLALGTDGVQQVGAGYTGLIFHALLWSGTADSAVDLHPTKISGIISSEVYGISGNQQVGAGDDGVGGDFSHALLWNGTADSAVDLHPTNLDSFVDSYDYATNGAHQVGLGANNDWTLVHALLWSGTANSAVDLHALLPAGFTSSFAWSIDAQDHIFGTATDAAGRLHAVEWAPVPEPSAIVLVATGATIAFVCSRRHGRRAGLLFACGVLFGCWSPRAASAAYTFTSIADSTTAAPTGNPFLSFRDAAVSGNNVAFGATFLANPFIEELARLAPFGLGNPDVTLLVPGTEAVTPSTVGEGKHLRFRVRQRGRDAGSAIAFGQGSHLDRLRAAGLFDVACRLHENRWNGTVAPQLVVRRIFDTADGYEELRGWLADLWRSGEAAWTPEARRIFGELGLDPGEPRRRELLESESFRALLVDTTLLEAALPEAA